MSVEDYDSYSDFPAAGPWCTDLERAPELQPLLCWCVGGFAEIYMHAERGHFVCPEPERILAWAPINPPEVDNEQT